MSITISATQLQWLVERKRFWMELSEKGVHSEQMDMYRIFCDTHQLWATVRTKALAELLCDELNDLVRTADRL